MSLRDQLLKSGLASKQQAKKAARAAKKNQHKKQKAKAKGETDAEVLQKDDIQKKIEEDQQRQKELDRQRNLELVEYQKSYQATSIVYSEGEAETGGRVPYYFRDPNSTKIQVIHVSPGLQRVLSLGKVGIATLNDGKWYLLGQENCYKVKALKPELIVCLHEEEKK
ncbi:DUF2058 family protein [Pseudobacteriovorax antillogorgiicola]|uniref:DUF2058 domain-containing protein n=1 Tax=Pseudobacteriovorax antillogorgiicola TaxID=1513793 RepID=A0A1Y6C520_9BACT|nr:DUF2058 family protein [Pseudobacteriovorax antillogorgiicola]TCS49496.1 hypothetical protein EDD56_115178 [Pseudobacteriovorax antillogorgiicola]SMF45929.1 hypothetical protein SAMN06296036_1147 [Pseudobacteriovorax antillogorgiicola]